MPGQLPPSATTVRSAAAAASGWGPQHHHALWRDGGSGDAGVEQGGLHDSATERHAGRCVGERLSVPHPSRFVRDSAPHLNTAMSTDAIAGEAGNGREMQIPAAFQVAAPFGADFAGALLLPFERAGGVAL